MSSARTHTHTQSVVNSVCTAALLIITCFFSAHRYLSEFLYAWLMSTLSRADSSQMAEERIMEEQVKGRSSKKTKKKKKGALRGRLRG